MFLDRILPIRQLLINKKNIIIFAFLVLLLIASFSFYFFIFKSSALNTQGISDYSTTKMTEATTYFILQKDKGYIYKSKKEGIDAVKDFIKLNPSYNKAKLLPEGFDKNSALNRTARDSQDPFLQKKGIYLTNEHYFFEQKINGIPIYGAQLAVHLRNKNEIYSVSGNLVKTKETTKQKITEEKAKEVALSEAQKEGRTIELKVSKVYKSIINLKLLGVSSDETNYLTLAVEVDSKNILPLFSKVFFVDLASGKIVFQEDLIQEAMNRQVYNCNDTMNPPCPIAISEGGNLTGDADADSVYNIMADIYDYFFNNFNRDGMDGMGSPLRAYVHVYQVDPKGPCSVVKQASNGGGTMYYCTGTVVRDVTAHEFAHGVTSSTASLQYSYQSGALNESISDIFGSALDNNWTIGEGSVFGIIRDMSNPPARQDPDSLFSNNYWCQSGDKGGVHTNSGVLNKAFYLMTDGGSFNGCSINGIGRDRSHAIIYQALTRYLSPTSNFKSMYNSALQACNDLYPNSPECENVKAALQATEMDQQPDADQIGAKCQGLQPQQPVCAGGVAPTNPPVTPGTNPTSTPGPGQPTTTPVPTATGVPGQPTATPTTQPPGGEEPTLTPTPTPVQTYTCREASTGSKAKPGSIKIGSLICEPN